MTKFLSFFNLSRIHDSRDFLGISADRVKGNVIITLSRNIIIVVRICSQQQILSWSTQEKLSTKVIFDRNSNNYIGVFGNRFLRCWNATTVDISTVKKIKLQKPIIDIIPSENGVILLYGDGSWDEFAKAISLRNDFTSAHHHLDSVNLKYDHLNDVSIKCVLNGTKYLTYFEQSGEDQEIAIVIVPLHLADQRQRLKLKRKNMSADLAGYAIVEGENGFVLLTIWSDQRLFLLNLHDKMESETTPGNFVSTITALKADSPLFILGVAKNCVAIYGANNNQEGASLLLYNIQFKVVKAKQFFKIYFDSFRFWVVDDNIILAMGQNLSVVSYHMSQELLVDLVGTCNVYNMTFEGDLINEEDYLQSFCSFNENSSTFNPSNYNIGLTYEINQSNFVSSGKLCKYSSLHDQLETHIKVGEQKNFVNDYITIWHTPSGTHLMHGPLMEYFVRQLENCGSTEQEISEKLLFMLSKMNSSDLAKYMRRFSSIEESIFTKACFFILIKNCLESANTEKLRAYDEISTITMLLQPFRRSVQIKHVRQEINSSSIVLLLGYLYKLLSGAEFSEKCSFETCHIKVEMQIVQWFDVLIIAHFQHLALSTEVQLLNLLLKWSKLILDYKNEITSLEKLLALLYKFVQKEKILDSAHTTKWYCIEEFVF